MNGHIRTFPHQFAQSLLAAFLLSILSIPPGNASDEMAFSRRSTCEGSDCESYILARGVITDRTPQVFSQFLKHSSPARVYFQSDGGNLLGAMQLGRLIRQSGMDTRV